MDENEAENVDEKVEENTDDNGDEIRWRRRWTRMMRGGSSAHSVARRLPVAVAQGVF